MDKLQFQASANSTLGIEVELFIVDSLTQGLSNSASAVMERVGPVVMGNGASKVKHEAFEHTVEIVTDVCTNGCDRLGLARHQLWHPPVLGLAQGRAHPR